MVIDGENTDKEWSREILIQGKENFTTFLLHCIESEVSYNNIGPQLHVSITCYEL